MEDIFTLAPSAVELIKRATPTANIPFPRETNVITSPNKLGLRKTVILCNGDSTMTVLSLDDPLNRIKELYKMKKNGIITSEDFEVTKKKLLDRV